jgi:putative DNA primase/helicase
MTGDVRQALGERGIELQRYGPGEHRAPCPWCGRGPRDDALAVRIDQDGATWLCHRCGEKGCTRQTQDGAAAALRPQVAPRLEPQRHEVLSDWGRTLWENSRPIEPGTTAIGYLEGRGCLLPPFPDETHLRWHPALSDRLSGYTGPALVALVTDVDTGEPINLHRTWLAPDGSGKAAIDRPRRLLKGDRSRGVVRLWSDAEITMGLVVGEGIETCLAAARAGFTPCWAAMTAGNLKAFPVLPGLDGLTVLVDHDKPNPHTGIRAGHDAALAVIERYTTAGFDPERDLRIILPRSEGLDVADLVTGSAP